MQPGELLRPSAFLVRVHGLKQAYAGGLLVEHFAPIQRAADDIFYRILLSEQLSEEAFGVLGIDCELNSNFVVTRDDKSCRVCSEVDPIGWTKKRASLDGGAG